MRGVARFVRVSLVLPAAVLVAIQARDVSGQAQADSPKGNALVLGQVIDAATKEGVPHAYVSIYERGEANRANLSKPPAPRQVIADASGRFMFRNLSPGQYSIRADGAGFTGGYFGQVRPGGSGQSCVITRDDEKRNDVVIPMWKTASISGRVIDEAGEPVTSQAVLLFWHSSSRFGGQTRTQTDDRGVFRFRGLYPGEYLVGIAAISETTPIATVEAYRQIISSGGRLLDQPMYRNLVASGAEASSSYGYRAGNFIVSFGDHYSREGTGHTPLPGDDAPLMIYARHYYSNASTASKATVIDLASGEDRRDINLQLRLTPTRQITGTLYGPTGPTPNIGLKLYSAETDETSGRHEIEVAATVTDLNGRFTFLAITPGRYKLEVLLIPLPLRQTRPVSWVQIDGPNGMMMATTGGSPAGPEEPAQPSKDPTLWAALPVVVGDSDVSDLRVPLSVGTRVSGRVTFEGALARPNEEQLRRGMLTFWPLDGRMPEQMYSTTRLSLAGADGRFQSIGLAPGRYLVEAVISAVPGATASWRLKSVTLNGRDVTDDGLEIGTEDITSAVITFTDKSATVNGTVIGPNGQPINTDSVIIVPADSETWRTHPIVSRRVRTARTTGNGSFSITDLPAGAYFLVAVSETSLGAWDPRLLDAISSIGTRIVLAEGQTLTQTLTLRTLR